MSRSFDDDIRDPRWRIEESGLYWIVTKDVMRGKDVSDFKPYKPFPHQIRLNHEIYNKGRRRILVPKARRMGFSTDINLCQLDFCLNNNDFHSRIVDMSEDDAKDKLINRVQRAWRQLEETLDVGLKDEGMSGKEIKWSNGSRFTASISGRGSEAAHFLHVSELGPIDFKDPKRADEIIDGAFPAADGGIIVVESTAKGPQGHFKRLCDEAGEVPEEALTPKDWVVMFFAWWEDPRHEIEGKYSRVGPDNTKYLDYVEEQIGKKLNPRQRLWYEVSSRTTKNMRYEYPSLLEECWEQPIEGAIYANQINKARGEGKIGNFEWEKGVPTYTIWDLGGKDNMRCLFFQIIAGEIRIVDATMGGMDMAIREDGPGDPGEWVKHLHQKPYWYGSHILPHDGDFKTLGNVSFKRQLMKAGLLDNIRVMPAAVKNDPWKRINETLLAFNKFTFNTKQPTIKTFINHLMCYNVETMNDGITINELPTKKWPSHYSETFGSIIEAIDRGFCGSHIGHGTTRRARIKPRYKAYDAYAT